MPTADELRRLAEESCSLPGFVYNQKELAAAMGISPSYLTDLIKQRKPWRYEIVRRLPQPHRAIAMRAIAKELRSFADALEADQ